VKDEQIDLLDGSFSIAPIEPLGAVKESSLAS
jgi:hypothetical protein